MIPLGKYTTVTRKQVENYNTSIFPINLTVPLETVNEINLRVNLSHALSTHLVRKKTSPHVLFVVIKSHFKH